MVLTQKMRTQTFSLGIGGRFMITKRVGLIMDYLYTFS